MQKGKIGVTTENIFPVIKQFLYSDREIFLREIVSNAVDATQKLKTMASKGDFKGEMGDLKVTVTVGKDTITVSDRGIGMTASEIDKYINQIAFSGANDFLEKYKNDATAIIGHFGLGFYSAFMVSKKVEIITKSYQEGSQAVKWSCDGSPEFQITDSDKADRGTDIILYLDDDSKEYLVESTIQGLLKKYCRFLPVQIACGKKKEWKDGKEVETAEDNIINSVEPLWTRTPSELKDEDYKNFYRELYPMSDEPMFWIHLNVDFPFHLTGILYFPKIKSNLDLQKNKIQLYCNQVYVTDSVEGIVPDFMTLLHGVIDSPDIPLNVSRSYLQSDSNVKKISGYITKKVADRLSQIFKNDRKEFETKWDDVKLFIAYGMLTEEEFYGKMEKIALFKDTDGQYFTYEEYKKLIEGSQTDRNKSLIYLYATNREEQYSFIEIAKNKGYNVLMMDGNLDVALIGMLEQKFAGNSRFLRVDSDSIDNLIAKDDVVKTELPDGQKRMLTKVFSSRLPKIEKADFHVDAQSLGEQSLPVMITCSEYMRRMKDMSAIQSGMSFYGEMPDMYTVILNRDHKLVKKILEDAGAACDAKVKPEDEKLSALKDRQAELRKAREGKKDEDVPQAEKDEMTEIEGKINATESIISDIYSEYASTNDVVSELIDLALLQNGMLKGEALAAFIRRSVELI
ncbi:MAG: molecular chaperone HtpG [Bacteroidetes bacterium]|nr:molecular chaperone HtpG [Candidatus Colenecus caballi]